MDYHGSIVILHFNTLKISVGYEEFEEFAGNFAEQLGSFLHYVVLRRKLEAERTAYEAFFNNKLDPYICWQALLGVLDLFLPDDQFTNLTPAPLKQLLIYSEGDDFLRIASGEGSLGSNYVLVDESISGLIIKNRESDFLLVNPSKVYLKEYKGYGEKPSQTELVIRLDSDDGAVGVINIEHEQQDAFNSLYVRSMRDAGKFLSPLVGGLQSRYDSFRKKEIGLLYIFTDLLSRMGDTYGHLVAQPILAARNAISEIRYLTEEGISAEKKTSLTSEVNRLTRLVDELQAHSDEFTKGLPEFISVGSQLVKIKIEQRLRAFIRLSNSEHVTIEISETGDNLCAYASSLFQEHVFNIVNNSFQQIRRQIFQGAMSSGVIRIRIERVPGTTRQNQGTGLNFIDLIISDNGGGALAKDFLRIGRPGFTTKVEHGSGFGVHAAKEYFDSIGGDMKWENIKNGFKTRIRMQEFDPLVHKESRLIDKIRAEAMK